MSWRWSEELEYVLPLATDHCGFQTTHRNHATSTLKLSMPGVRNERLTRLNTSQMKQTYLLWQLSKLEVDACEAGLKLPLWACWVVIGLSHKTKRESRTAVWEMLRRWTFWTHYNYHYEPNYQTFHWIQTVCLMDFSTKVIVIIVTISAICCL